MDRQHLDRPEEMLSEIGRISPASATNKPTNSSSLNKPGLLGREAPQTDA
jgi:hypothetical protein